MPGIVGLLVREVTGEEERMLKSMVGCMLHEPFYTHGTFFSPEHGLFMGYAAIQGSVSDCMPIWNETRTLALFLIGETYVDRGVIANLAHQAHVFNPDDASYLVHQFEESGEDLFKDLNGWCNGVLLDLRQSRAILFNDRYGIRRLYLHEYRNGLAFSSEAKSLLKVFPECRELDPDAVGELLCFDCVLENRTSFKNIRLLPPGSVWICRRGRVESKHSFDVSVLENQTPLPPERFFGELEDTFKRILPHYFFGGKTGLSLTGGLDTRSILACGSLAPGEIPCYTFGGSYRDILDVRLAPRVAAACGQTHEVLRLDDDTLISQYPRLVERAVYISDGIEGVDKADVIPLNQMARQIAPNRMTGKYGSQVLKGIVGFKERSPLADLIAADFAPYLERARETSKKFQGGNELSFALFKAIPWWWNGFVFLEASQLSVRSPYLDNDFIKVLYRAPKEAGKFGTRFQLDLIGRNKPGLMAIPTTGTHGGGYPRILAGGIKTALKALLILDKIHQREELPYGLTHPVGRLDYLLKPLHLDRLVMGFAEYRRYRTWFRDQLADYLQDVLLAPRTLSRPYWDKRNLTKVVTAHIHGRGTYLREIRKALQIELIHRVLLEH